MLRVGFSVQCLHFVYISPEQCCKAVPPRARRRCTLQHPQNCWHADDELNSGSIPEDFAINVLFAWQLEGRWTIPSLHLDADD